jgi:lipooligosaccharide transport system permease protein
MKELLTWPAVGWRAGRVWHRNVDVWRSYYKASLVGTLGEPLLFLVALGLGLGRFIPEMEGIPYLQFIAPGLVVSAAMYSSCFECTFGSFTRMVTQKTYQAIVVTPVNMEEVTAGDILWGATKGGISGLAIIFILGLFGLLRSPLVVMLPFLALLVGFSLASFSMFMTSLAYSYEFFSYYFTLFISPMFLFSGIFFPISSLPASAVKIALLFPLTHAASISRSLSLGRIHSGLLLDAAWLVIFSGIFFTLAVNNTKRRLIK